MKTEGPLQARMVQLARPLTLALLAFIGIVSCWTPLSQPAVAARWFAWPGILWFCPVPLLVVAFTAGLMRSLRRRPHAAPFVYALGVIFLGYTGLAISLWPDIIPPRISFWEAAAPPQSQGFALVGALFVIPMILMYTFWSYYVFRGKVRPQDSGYH